MILLHGKIYYLAPAYFMLLAGGVVGWERRIFSRAAAWLKRSEDPRLANGASSYNCGALAMRLIAGFSRLLLAKIFVAPTTTTPPASSMMWPARDNRFWP